MKVLFMGYYRTGVTVCSSCLMGKSINLLGIIIPTDRSQESLKSIKNFAKKNNVNIFSPINCNSKKFIGKIKKLSPDLIIVFNYSKILKKELFEIPKLGTINIHPSLLPKYRGAHVVNWVLINGEKETGVTVHYVDENIDSGDIICQKKIKLTIKDTCATLAKKIEKTAVKALNEVLKSLKTGNAKRKKQDSKKATYYKKRYPKDGKINWTKPAVEIYNLIRALVEPWPGAFYYNKKGKRIVIKKLISLKKIKKLKAEFYK